MKASNYFTKYFDTIGHSLKSIDLAQMEQATKMVLNTHQENKKIIILGNGGSSAMASHVSVDFTKTAGMRAVNFNEADLLTCLANDYGYEHWVAKALEFYADLGDLSIIISSSGKSQNMLNGARKAKDMGLSLITLSGFSADNPLKKIGDLNLWVDSKAYNIVEMTHHVWLLAIIDYIIELRKFKLYERS